MPPGWSANAFSTRRARATEATAAPDTAEVAVRILETGFLIYSLRPTVVKP